MIEIMVTLLIISILTAVAVPVYRDASAGARRNTCFANQRTIQGSKGTFFLLPDHIRSVYPVFLVTVA